MLIEYTCKFCNEKFHSKTHTMKHISKMHEDEVFTSRAVIVKADDTKAYFPIS